MTLSEFEHKLKAMPPAEKAKLLKDLGNLEEDPVSGNVRHQSKVGIEDLQNAWRDAPIREGG